MLENNKHAKEKPIKTEIKINDYLKIKMNTIHIGYIF
jgi:hypothetical protein